MALIDRQVTICAGSLILAARDQVSGNLGTEVAILNLQNGIYYGLESVGARIWDMIQTARKVSAIRDALVEEFEVEPDRCLQDLISLLRGMAAEGLIEVRDETAL